MSFLIIGKYGNYPFLYCVICRTLGISKIHKVPLGLITKSLKDSIVKAFEKLANILLTDFRLTLSKTRQNTPRKRTKTDSPNNEINVTIEIKKPKKFGFDVLI